MKMKLIKSTILIQIFILFSIACYDKNNVAYPIVSICLFLLGFNYVDKEAIVKFNKSVLNKEDVERKYQIIICLFFTIAIVASVYLISSS